MGYNDLNGDRLKNAPRLQVMASQEQDARCVRCHSELSKFPSEINIHFPGYEGLTKPTVWVFPTLLVCLRCGLAQFSIAETELRRLADDDADDAGVVCSQAA
jgi:hypothetical protein